MFTVDLATGSCMRCPDRHHLQLSRRHIEAKVYIQSGTTTAEAYKFFHHTYTAPVYAQALQQSLIDTTFIPALVPNSNIYLPPLYIQAGAAGRADNRDVTSREKRINSRGEPKSRSIKRQI